MTSAPSPLCTAIERLLLGIRSGSRERAEELFKNLPGRGGFGPPLRRWLEQEPSPFGELVHAEDIDGIQDHGVDVLLGGVRSGTRVGFQVKSNRDLAAKDFSQRLKAQLSDAQDYGVELIVVVFACRPTDKNLEKIKIVQSAMQRRSRPAVVCLSPERAAALYDLFDQPLPPLDAPERNWSDFFRAVGQSQLLGEYLDPWPSLPPDRRYLPPEEWPEIRSSLETHRLTILVGPPASGKTFTGLQLLWKAFQAGYPVFWVTAADVDPTDGPIPAPRAGWQEIGNFKRRIDGLLRTLGPEPGRKPLDKHDLVSRLLVPGAVVYIEDPFGKSDVEYALSLASYEYFDIQRLIDILNESSERADCRIVVTSREPLFRRWLSDTRAKHQKAPEASVITLSRSSYPPGPLFDHLALLAQTRELAEPEEIAELLTPEIECPFEGDILIRSLSAGAGVAEAREVLRGWQGDLRSKIEGRLTPEDDGETLVLLLIAAFSSADDGPIHPEEMYTKVHRALGLQADPQEVFRRTSQKLEPFLASRKGSNAGAQLLVPHHSIIREALQEQLAAAERRSLLRRVALALLEAAPTQVPSSASFGSRLPGGPSWYAHGQIAAYLVSLGIAFDGDKELSALEKILFNYKSLGRYEHHLLMQLWPQMPVSLRERFFTKLRQSLDSDRRFLRESASYLPWAPLAPADAWHLLGMLFEDPQRGAEKTILNQSPWAYLFLHLSDAPEDFLKKLDDWALRKPVFFVYALGEGLVRYWDNLSPKPHRIVLWRSCFLLPDCLSHRQVQERLLETIAKYWHSVSHFLRELFDFQLLSKDAVLRKQAGAQAMFRAGDFPELEIFTLVAAQDPDPQVAVETFRWGRGDEAHRHVAEVLLGRATPGLAAEMVIAILEEDDRDISAWKKEVLTRCEEIGGDAARAAIVYSVLEGEPGAKELGFGPGDSVFGEPEIVRAAWLWAHLNSLRARPAISDSDLLRLLSELKDPQIRGWCLFYVSYQLTALPEYFQEFLDRLSETSEKDATVIRAGAEDRQPSSPRNLRRFPIDKMIP